MRLQIKLMPASRVGIGRSHSRTVLIPQSFALVIRPLSSVESMSHPVALQKSRRRDLGFRAGLKDR